VAGRRGVAGIVEAPEGLSAAEKFTVVLEIAGLNAT